MSRPSTDDKTDDLLKLLAQLRDHIDIFRIIGLNTDALRRSEISQALLGYLAKSAQESLAIYLCKICESSTRNDLNSIPGIIESFSVSPWSDLERTELATFGKRNGNDTVPSDARSYLEATLVLFRSTHSEPLRRLKEFRDTIGAHSDSSASLPILPSHAEFEALFGFARDFYEVVSHFNGVGPAVIPTRVGRGFIRLLRSLGVDDLKFDFDGEE